MPNEISGPAGWIDTFKNRDSQLNLVTPSVIICHQIHGRANIEGTTNQFQNICFKMKILRWMTLNTTTVTDFVLQRQDMVFPKCWPCLPFLKKLASKHYPWTFRFALCSNKTWTVIQTFIYWSYLDILQPASAWCRLWSFFPPNPPPHFTNYTDTLTTELFPLLAIHSKHLAKFSITH